MELKFPGAGFNTPDPDNIAILVLYDIYMVGHDLLLIVMCSRSRAFSVSVHPFFYCVYISPCVGRAV